MSSLIMRLIENKCCLIPALIVPKLMKSPKEVGSFIEYLELHSCNKFSSYHFTDVLHSLSMASLMSIFREEDHFVEQRKQIKEKFGKQITDISEM